MPTSNAGSLVSLSDAASILARSGVVAFPTETYYALGCDAADRKAVAKVYQLKKRTATKPLPLVFGDREMVFDWMRAGAVERGLLDFWPGPLTLLLRPLRPLPSCLLDSKGLVAVRVSSHPVPCALSGALSSPLTASSANVQSHRPARVFRELEPDILLGADAVLADGPEPLGARPSTIVEPLGGGRVLVVREGAVSPGDLKAAGFEAVFSQA